MINVMRFQRFVSGFVLLACIFFTGSIDAQAKKTIPSISANELIDVIGKEKGKVVVINIFASWCAPCREEVPGLIEIRKAFPEKELAIIGISVDKPTDGNSKSVAKALITFADEMKFNYPVYVSAPGFEEAVGVSAIPQLLVFDKTGQIVINHKGLVSQEDLTNAIKKIQAAN